MKKITPQRLNRNRRSSEWLGYCSITFVVLTAGHAIAQDTWDGGGTDNNWSTDNNWGDNIAPSANSNTGVLTFGGSVRTTSTNDILGLTTGDILFTNAGPGGTAPANLTNAFTLTGNAITLGGNITTSGAQATGSGGIDITDSIGFGLILDGTRTITTNRVGGTGNNRLSHNLTISGQITESGGTQGIVKGGDADLSLSNGANAFSGDLTITGAGAVVANNLQPSSMASSIGSGTAINLAGGTLRFTGSAAPTGDINRSINLTSTSTAGGTLDNSGTAPLTFNGSFTNSGNGAKTLSLSGSETGANTLASTLVNSVGGGILSLNKSGTGTWTLSGNNTFTGGVIIDGGTLRVSSMGNSGSSNLGLGTLVQIGNSSRSGTLDYTGTGDVTTRQVKIGGFINTTGSGNATIVASATSGTSTGLKFTNSNFNIAEGTVPGTALTRTLTLRGANTDQNEISGVIIDGNSSVLTALTKTDAGLWILSGASSYTGVTTVSGGTLVVGSNAPSGANGALGKATSEVILGTNGGNNDASLLIGGAFTVGRDIRVPTNNSTDTGTRVLTLGGNTAHVSTFSGNVVLGSNNQAGRGVTLTAASGGQVTFSGVIQNPTAMDATSYTVTKSGSGTVVLSNTNTYTGATAVTAGKLLIGTTGSLANTASVTVGGNGASGTPTLGGGGTIAGATIIAAAGTGVVGTHAPGVAGTNGGVGSQTFSKGLSYQAGSIFEWDLKTAATGTAGTDFDGVTLNTATGSLAVDGNVTTGSIFKIVLGTQFAGTDAFWSSSQSWNVFTATNGATLGNSVFSRFQLFDSDSATVAENFAAFGNFGFTNNGATGTLTWTAVPEPTSALASLLIGAGLLRRRRL